MRRKISEARKETIREGGIALIFKVINKEMESKTAIYLLRSLYNRYTAEIE